MTERLNLTEHTFYDVVRRFKTLRGHIPPALYADALDMLNRDGGAEVATVARHKGRLVEIVADEPAANDSGDNINALETSSDGDDDGCDGDATREAA